MHTEDTTLEDLLKTTNKQQAEIAMLEEALEEQWEGSIKFFFFLVH